ncbi:hypothetical protein ODZ84_18395 [Chryseobacterium fluminis]|uniref:hypothetical protein n=1 Tax=Chryseobacterium fluminis TaxID=2983606 RepID=UPI00224DE3CC|nr:hypothetical protein [Chryseobacterium sp. MMS21-Ot14]UZT97150.1 hypothetical protein ODZ84_18395 [Chryseobacterium sp. MMS21-Ot14]
MKNEGRYPDVLTLEDGSELYFDITDAHQRIAFLSGKKIKMLKIKKKNRKIKTGGIFKI